MKARTARKRVARLKEGKDSEVRTAKKGWPGQRCIDSDEKMARKGR